MNLEKTLYQLRGTKQEFLFEFSNYKRFLFNLLLNNNQAVINQKEIRVAGLRRTGNHAIIGWIRAQNPEHALHFNHPLAGGNPYQSHYRHHKNSMLEQGAKGEFTPQSLLIISYEDQLLEKIGSRRFEIFHDIYVGVSEKRYDVVILRDPFNLLASQLKADMVAFSDGSAEKIMGLWKSYAREFLGETSYLKQTKVPINFNLWHQDQDYRQELAQMLELEFTDEGREKVRGYGGGSSFNRQNMDGQASKMDLSNRWRFYEQDERFWQLLQDDELIDYATTIFGEDGFPFDRLVTTPSSSSKARS
jgi:hypothetical protein